MARIGRYRIGFRGSPGGLIWSLVGLLAVLFVGDKVLVAFVQVITSSGVLQAWNPTTGTGSLFYEAYKFLGIAGPAGTTTMIAVLGIIAVAALVMRYIRVSKL